jgi:hypothetical protein
MNLVERSLQAIVGLWNFGAPISFELSFQTPEVIYSGRRNLCLWSIR